MVITVFVICINKSTEPDYYYQLTSNTMTRLFNIYLNNNEQLLLPN